MKKMKKKIKYIFASIAFFGVMLLQVGCESAFEEALDRTSDSRESLEGMLNDPDKVKGMLNAAYLGMPKHRTELYFWTTTESLSDNCFEVQGQSMEQWRSGKLSPSTPAVWVNHSAGNAYHSASGGSFWGRYWGAIRFCNNIIDNIDKITVPLEEFPQADRDQFLDEALVLRAYYHWMLISLYGPLPFMETNLTVNFDGWQDLTRPSYDEIANKIADELQAVIDRGNIPLKRDPNKINDKYRVPLSFAYGLKSRVLLYNASPLNNPSGDPAKYTAAAADAKQFLDLNIYSLEPFETSKKRLYNSPMSENVEETEVIWRGRDKNPQMCFVHGMNFSATVPVRCQYANFKAGETPTQEMVDCYELKDGSLIIDNYDATHAKPTFTSEALTAGYDDENDPYGMSTGPKRDDRFYRDIMFNGNTFGESFELGTMQVWTYLEAPGTGSNGNVGSGTNNRTYTGYYYGKDRDPLWYGTGNPGLGNSRANHHSVLMRYAEIYLNYAEALCGAGQLNEACDALDMTRLRANQPSIKAVPGFQLDKEWLMKRIQNERRVELVLEDHRFFDVRRWELISDQNNNTISGMEIKKVGDNQFVHKRYQMPFLWVCHNEKYKVLPIPLDDKKLLPKIDQPAAWQ